MQLGGPDRTVGEFGDLGVSRAWVVREGFREEADLRWGLQGGGKYKQAETSSEALTLNSLSLNLKPQLTVRPRLGLTSLNTHCVCRLGLSLLQ